MTEREALKLARSVISSINQGKQHSLTRNEETVFWQREEWVRWALDEVLPSIDKALSQPEHEKYCSVCQGCGQLDTGIMESPVTICKACNGTGLKAQPAVSEQHKQSTSCGEPVAFLTNRRQRLNIEFNASGFQLMPWSVDWKLPLYTTPPTQCNCSQRSEARASKPLTDEEAFELIEQDYRMEEYAQAALQLIRRTEAAHGIKE